MTRRDEVKDELKRLARRIIELQRKPCKTEEEVKEHIVLSRLLMSVEDILLNLKMGVYD